MSQPILTQANLTGQAKLDAVTSLITKLGEDLEMGNLQPQQRDAALEELKIYGRDPRNSDPIFTPEGIRILTKHAFDGSSDSTSRAALKVLANAMLLKPSTRQIFVSLGYEDKACQKLKNDSFDDEFLVSRVLFLTTYNTNIDMVAMIQKHGVAENIVDRLAKHADLLTSGERNPRVDPMEDMAMNEILRLQFNLTQFCPSEAAAFSAGIPYIIALLWKQEITPNKPLDPPFNSLVNALLNLQLEDESIQPFFYPEDEPKKVAERLIRLLDLSLEVYPDSELEVLVTPVVGVLLPLHNGAPEEVKRNIRTTLLPTEEDRKEVLGRGTSLTSRLLRTSNNPMTPSLREAIMHLLYDMSDKDPSKFVDNVGYGLASGFLFQNNIPMPAQAAGGSDGGDSQRPVNPITGQFVDMEREVDVPEMTEEEKEREAERLFVLFERLKRTGIVDIQNPVEQAVRSGRYEDLGENRVEELD